MFSNNVLAKKLVSIPALTMKAQQLHNGGLDYSIIYLLGKWQVWSVVVVVGKGMVGCEGGGG